MLTWRELVHSTLMLFRLSFRIVFRRKLLFMALGVSVYYAIVYAVAVFEPGAGFSASDAHMALVQVPGVLLAIYLSMDLVARERDRNTLETLFSTATSHYAIWTVRLVSVYAVLAVTLMVMSTVAYFFFAEFPFVVAAINAFAPAFLLANVTFFFAVMTRSGNTAGMLALGFIWLVLMFSDVLTGTRYDLFLDPFAMPLSGNIRSWIELVVLNRLGVLGVGALLLFLSLRRMERRERLLA